MDTNIETKKTMLWINAPVMEQIVMEHNDVMFHNKAIGVVGTGIDLTGFIEDIYSYVTEDMPFYLFNTNNVITGAQDWNLTASQQTLTQYFGSLGDTIASFARKITEPSAEAAGLASTMRGSPPAGELRTFTAENTEYAVSYTQMRTENINLL